MRRPLTGSATELITSELVCAIARQGDHRLRFTSERQLEGYVRRLLETKITSRHPHIYALEYEKAADVVICRDGQRPAVFFLEIKLFQRHHGRMAIGTDRGRGFQPEIITRSPDYFETHLRWLIVDGREPSASFRLVSTDTVRRYLSGGKIGSKYNNIQPKIFKGVAGIDEDALVAELSRWLLE